MRMRLHKVRYDRCATEGSVMYVGTAYAADIIGAYA
jgi:hypothetical protein